MTRKTYIGTPHRDSVSGQSLVTVCDGQKSEPLPLRLDLFNHPPTGFSWGYGGSGAAQCSFALLMDYFGDEEQARALYQDFKFRVIAKFPANSEWTLSGREIERAISRLSILQKPSSSLP